MTGRRSAVPLQDRLALLRFMCREFGYVDMDAMLERLRDAPPTFAAGGESEYARALYLHPENARISAETFSEYDANIARHSQRLHMTKEHGRSWKPHQYLALLFTEHYLNRYFSDPEALRADLNAAKTSNPMTRSIPDYTQRDLRTIALQSATGSGKTLIMHASILQYQHWLNRSGQRLNNIILVTPNEHMSRQHNRDLQESNISARLFSNEAGPDLLAPVEIIDLNKLAEKRGVKRVAVRDFGENNLVLVDEGHLGASGKAWRERREELARGGFTFEYSATFNQITGKDSELRDAYGKCLLFDYAYREFYKDGYGKDYSISNLPRGAEDENSRMYLLGCLLTFYLQCCIWRGRGAEWTDFNLAKPLWVFLGKTVIGSSKADAETRSDVINILNFFGWFLANKKDACAMLKSLLADDSGLTNERGDDFFADRFARFRQTPPNDLYADICATLFHGEGQLHVVYLTGGGGELHLRTADHPPFGVVNIGDSAALYKVLKERADSDFCIERELGFVQVLFPTVEQADSKVNIVIGARRFIAGWNCWRVSTMSLMHVGVGEGPEIIQMFGRGVRLKGWKMNLKRHRKSGVEPPPDSDDLAELETLHIFGLRANYMQVFRDLLEEERIALEHVRLPVTWNFAKTTDLKLIRLKKGEKYMDSGERLSLPPPDTDSPVIKLDLYSRLQSAASSKSKATEEREKIRFEFTPGHTALFDKTRIHDSLIERKRQTGWHNLVLDTETLDELLADGNWYELHAPPEKTDPKNFGNIQALEDVAIDLLAQYADRYWRKRRSKWEHENVEVVTLDEDDPNNIREHRLSLNKEERLIEDVRALRTNLGHSLPPELGLIVLPVRAHAYKPLLYAREGCEITIQPVPLNRGEKDVVERLEWIAGHHDDCLQGRELFLIRNRTRGRGVSFFDDCGYYPDFIIWLKDDHNQHVVFLDPKGLGYYGQEKRRKVELHTGIKEIEKRVRKDDPTLHLHAYVLSVTSPEKISERRTKQEWKEDGVYFLQDSDCLKQIITDALESAA
ncbi:MAG: DEAD/DEAH box helicase family protein [Candidatus Poribacteria bacterium]|nr:DEAD/DEAH box helicase family protein [Candidatus Poribacteria bacterium]